VGRYNPNATAPIVDWPNLGWVTRYNLPTRPKMYHCLNVEQIITVKAGTDAWACDFSQSVKVSSWWGPQVPHVWRHYPPPLGYYGSQWKPDSPMIVFTDRDQHSIKWADHPGLIGVDLPNQSRACFHVQVWDKANPGKILRERYWYQSFAFDAGGALLYDTFAEDPTPAACPP